MPFNKIPKKATYKRFAGVGWKIIIDSTPVSYTERGEAIYTKEQCEPR